ncbi:MAG TPA: hypothetical protein VF260_04975 [Bacilli bacterium]
MSKRQICPWCATEIVWDEEIGPEAYCPHCFNELGEYRTVHVELDPPDKVDDDGKKDNKPGSVIQFPATAKNPSGEVKKGLIDWDNLTVKELGVVRFAEAVQALIDAQDEAPECPHCRELMLRIGTRTVAESEFTPLVPAELTKPVLPGPFKLDLFVCPSCFHISTFLAKTDRVNMIDSFFDR